jgi:hypothetical protein
MTELATALDWYCTECKISISDADAHNTMHLRVMSDRAWETLASAAATEPLRYFGRCAAKGCKHSRVVDERSHEQIKRVPNDQGEGDMLVVVNVIGQEFPLTWRGGPAWWAAHDQAALTCPNHREALRFKRGQFSHNPSKRCDARCSTATGHTCDCSCGGRNHGGEWTESEDR